MTIQQLPGKFNITGTNQDSEATRYKGTLELSLNHNNRIIAKWLINNSEVQIGTGFFKENILVINFNYKGEDNNIYKGVVVYKCITQDVLDGFWSEKHGNPMYIGSERCFRVENNRETTN